MNSEIIEVIDLYNELKEHGVMFYYGSEIIPHGEITNFDILENDIVQLELNDFENYEMYLDDFIENYSKEGVNYHTWALSRKFDTLINEL